MISLERVTRPRAMILKEIRLRALQDAPSAFSSTYEKESRLSDADWLDRAAQWSDKGSVVYLAMDASVAIGMAAGFLDRDDPKQARLVSMWVAPTYRLRGVGAMLVKAIVDWARTQSVARLRLLVTSNNDGAIKFYQRLGFALTGIATPHANDPILSDCEMVKLIAQE